MNGIIKKPVLNLLQNANKYTPARQSAKRIKKTAEMLPVWSGYNTDITQSTANNWSNIARSASTSFNAADLDAVPAFLRTRQCIYVPLRLGCCELKDLNHHNIRLLQIGFPILKKKVSWCQF